VQPLAAAIAGVRAGPGDAATNDPSYFWGVLFEPSQRRVRIRSGFRNPAGDTGYITPGKPEPEEYMKNIFVYAACAMVCAGLPAQTPENTAAKPAAAGAERLSPEETNTRAYIELLRTDVKKSKSQIMGEVMQLDTDEAQKFWPLYKDFETDLSKLGDQVVAAVSTYAENYGKMTDALADQLANKVLSIEQQRNALKKKHYDRMKASLGGITAMRFLQVENQLERLVDLQIAAQLPISSE